jgi:hypothetical protein
MDAKKNIEITARNKKIIQWQYTQNFVNHEFIKWKNDIPVKSKNSKSIEHRLKKKRIDTKFLPWFIQ